MRPLTRGTDAFVFKTCSDMAADHPERALKRLVDMPLEGARGKHRTAALLTQAGDTLHVRQKGNAPAHHDPGRCRLNTLQPLPQCAGLAVQAPIAEAGAW